MSGNSLDTEKEREHVRTCRNSTGWWFVELKKSIKHKCEQKRAMPCLRNENQDENNHAYSTRIFGVCEVLTTLGAIMRLGIWLHVP